MVDPFVANMEHIQLNINKNKNMVDLLSEGVLRVEFQLRLSKSHFYSVENQCKFFQQFLVYLCEKHFLPSRLLKLGTW